VPVRLFTGHTASNVNCVQWHPNCNYIVTGCDDRTVRMWDIQTGQTVRLLNGCAAGVNKVLVSPGGQYVAGADYSGAVHLWDLGTGKRITEFRQDPSGTGCETSTNLMTHSLSFSACGSALAAGGDDCCVRIWDVRTEALADKSPMMNTPAKAFSTKKTLIMDLSFTKRNLLLACGKFVNPVPLVSSGTD
jgi:transcription initiation factor TFIID subunit 5